jgi:hypothetical protein
MLIVQLRRRWSTSSMASQGLNAVADNASWSFLPLLLLQVTKLYWVTPRMYAPCYTPDRPTRTPICPSRVEGPFVVLCLAQHDPDAESRENRGMGMTSSSKFSGAKISELFRFCALI